MENYNFTPNSTSMAFNNPNPAVAHSKLWNESQITSKFVSPNLSFSKEKRFKWSSIYWPQDHEGASLINKKRKSDVHQIASKISKMIDEEEKNQLRIKLIKRSFSIGKSQISSARKEAQSILSTKKPFKLSKDNQFIVRRLTVIQTKKQSLLRDRHGNRCHLLQDPQSQNTDQLSYLAATTGFKTSRKMKLQLPHNYNPGPGTYQIKRFLSQLDNKSQSYSPKSRQISTRQK